MTDIAHLRFDIDSSPAARAASDLERMNSAAKKVEDQATRLVGATDKLADGQGRASEAARRAEDQVTRSLGAGARAIGQVDAHVVAWQVHMAGATSAADDMGRATDRAASSANKLTLAQQAVNVALQGQGRTANALRPVLVALVGVFGALTNVAFLAAGGLLALGFRHVIKGSEDVAASLSLSEKQMERLRRSGESTSATLGDAVKALGTTIRETFSKEIEAASNWWNGFLDEMTANTAKEVKAIVGFFGGAVGAIKAAWGLLPAAVGDLAVQAANLVIHALNFMIARARDAINAILAFTDAVLVATGRSALSLRLSETALAPITNSWRNGGRAMAEAVADGWLEGSASAVGAAERIMGRWEVNTQKTFLARIKDAAGKDPSGTDRTADLRRQLEMEERMATARATGSEDLIRAEERYQRGLELTARYRAAGYADAGRRAEALLQIEDRILAVQKEKERVEKRKVKVAEELVFLAQRQASVVLEAYQTDLELARLRGEPLAIRNAERELYIYERSLDLVRQRRAESEAAARAQAAAEWGVREEAEAYGQARDMFARSFSDGVRAALSGDVSQLLDRAFGSAVDHMLNDIGGRIYDSIFGAGRAASEGATQGVALGHAAGPLIALAGQNAASVMATAIVTAGDIAAQAMARAIAVSGSGGGSAASLVNVGASIASVIGRLPGFASGGSILPSGSASNDNQLVAFWKSPRERVDIGTPEQLAGWRRAANQPLRLVVEASPYFDVKVRQVAGPVAAQAGAAAVNVARSTIPAEMQRKQRYSYGG